MAPKPPLPELAFADAAALEAWLDAEHGRSDGIWLKLAKKDTGVATATYDEAVDLALCFGWIDGQARRFDDVYFGVRYTPRRPRSVWSKRNVDRVERLLAAGRMRPSGLAQVEAARADGRWAAAYDGATTATVPADLQAVLDAEPATAEAFAALSNTDRVMLLQGLQTAVKPETRARRLERALTRLRG